jgi:acetyl esterase
MRERKPIDRALRRVLDEQAAALGDTSQMTDEERARARRTLMVQALESRGSIPGLPNGVKTRDVALSKALTGRLYTPPCAAAPLPALVYLHGGGWVVGSIATHDPFCRLLSDAAGVIVLSNRFMSSALGGINIGMAKSPRATLM